METPVTLAVDCGGTGLKAAAVAPDGTMLTERVRVRTPYPCPPHALVDAVSSLADTVATRAGGVDRVSVGFPGMVRGGVVRATPHYVTESGPFSPVRPDLVRAWHGFDVRGALQEALGRPTRVLNDAEVAGLAVITGRGFEVVLTLGTGLGCALFHDGRVLPKIELSQARFRKGETYDEQLGGHVRVRIGSERWTRRVRRAITGLEPVLGWDRLYVGGGGARHLTGPVGTDVTVVSNDSGLLGGIRLWDGPSAG